MTKNKSFEQWFNNQMWGNESWKDGLYEAWQAAQQQSAGEIAELKAENQRQYEYIGKLQTRDNQNKLELTHLKADNERLREALQLIQSDKLSSRFDCQMVASEALSATTYRLERDNEVIERWFNLLETNASLLSDGEYGHMYADGAMQLFEVMLKLKEKQ